MKTLECMDVKFVAKRVLQAIQALHKNGYTHTGIYHLISDLDTVIDIIFIDIKPDNILVDYDTTSSRRFTDVQLADFGDVTRIDPKDYLKVGMDGPHMGAAIFRSPEAMMQLRWGQSTDIWSFGATVNDVRYSIVWILLIISSL